jgi:hypothetical protein
MLSTRADHVHAIRVKSHARPGELPDTQWWAPVTVSRRKRGADDPATGPKSCGVVVVVKQANAAKKKRGGSNDDQLPAVICIYAFHPTSGRSETNDSDDDRAPAVIGSNLFDPTMGHLMDDDHLPSSGDSGRAYSESLPKHMSRPKHPQAAPDRCTADITSECAWVVDPVCAGPRDFIIIVNDQCITVDVQATGLVAEGDPVDVSVIPRFTFASSVPGQRHCNHASLWSKPRHRISRFDDPIFR